MLPHKVKAQLLIAQQQKVALPPTDTRRLKVVYICRVWGKSCAPFDPKDPPSQPLLQRMALAYRTWLGTVFYFAGAWYARRGTGGKIFRVDG
jgi:hypothetical protein